MEEEEYLEEFVIEPFVGGEELDLNYEFDAPRFHDFTLPETDLEAFEAGRWFNSTKTYPPSPFMIKLNWEKGGLVEIITSSDKLRNDERMNYIGNDSDSCTTPKVSATDDNNKDSFSSAQMAQASPKSKTNSPVKSTRSSTLMKPTASHLAKQNKPRFQKKLENIDEKGSGSFPVIDNQATKRQKLEAGYLQKVAHLKHQVLLLHKVPKKVATIDVNYVHTRLKVTIPREPDLATARRAQIHRSKINTGLGEHAESNTHSFKAHPLNRKILEAPSLLPPKKKISQLQEFQVFHLKTSERTTQHTSSNVGSIDNFKFISQYEAMDGKRLNALSQEKCKTINKSKPHPITNKILSRKEKLGVFQNSKQETTVPRELGFSTDKRFLVEPPIELLSKLSLASDAQLNGKSPSRSPLPTKDSKENTPKPFKARKSLGGKQYQCGSYRMIPEVGPQLYSNRSRDIC
ncbi:protein TPX2-like isoform X2 [Quercus lobata]|uniref:protein TPX2-like isoform X2 n=1 Tax=Quercus lobata TaxID=97700 RepID=UPI00124521E9|nr:protein TPX2-like isoform X2 [Quercus lobata]